jgi:hypothetical protein
MSHWGAAEMAACQRQEARHATRLAQLVARLREQPVRRSPSAWPGWAETGAASRVLANPELGVPEMLSGHTHATLDRLRAQEVGLLVHDPTVLDDGTTPPQAGIGPVKVKSRAASLWHPTVAFPPERVH